MNECIFFDFELGGLVGLFILFVVLGWVIVFCWQFVKVGVVVFVVLGSLLSKLVLVIQVYNCIILGQMLGNVLLCFGKVDCKIIGKLFGYWKNVFVWLMGMLKGNLFLVGCSFGGNKGMVFNGFSSGGQMLMDVFCYKVEFMGCNIYGYWDLVFFICLVKVMMFQVFNIFGGLNDIMIYVLGCFMVVIILNVLSVGLDYLILVVQVIKMFNVVCLFGGKYQVNVIVFWDDN